MEKYSLGNLLRLGACIVGEFDNELSGVDSVTYNEIKSHFDLNTSEIITAAIILGSGPGGCSEPA